MYFKNIFTLCIGMGEGKWGFGNVGILKYFVQWEWGRVKGGFGAFLFIDMGHTRFTKGFIRFKFTT